MMKRLRIQDERVSAQQHKINSEACAILMIVLFVSILVQQFILNAPFEQYAVECICFFGISIYMIARYMMLGLNLYGEGKKSKSGPLINSIVAGVSVTAINGVLNFMRYAEKYRKDGMGFFLAVLVVTFISATFIAFVILSCLNYLNKKKQAKIQNQLDHDERNDE